MKEKKISKKSKNSPNNYRLVVLNEETFEERYSLRLSKLNVFAYIVFITLFIMTITTFIIFFTPVKEYVPGYDNVEFEMWAGQIEKGGVSVNVVEVRNPKPIDPDRKESNEANINKPLRFGSRTSITTAGNWE